MRKLALTVAALFLLAGIWATYALGAGTKTVTVRDNFFSARSVTVRRGAKVTWRWVATANKHNVTSKGHFKSRSQRSGSFTETFRTRGTFTVICTLHPTQMRMKVRVQ
jgi:plastocyanin